MEEIYLLVYLWREVLILNNYKGDGVVIMALVENVEKEHDDEEAS